MTRPGRHLLLLVAASGVVGATGCSEGPLVPTPPQLEMVIVGGDLQFGAADELLTSPLSVVVRRIDTDAPESGVTVLWTVEEGDASPEGGARSTTDDRGLASKEVRLGSAAGTIRIRASADGRPGLETSFTAFLVERPQLAALSVTQARAGDTLAVHGGNFSPVPEHNVVLFSGVRGRTLASTPVELLVEVPSCLPTRSVEVTAQLGTLVSGSVGLEVEDSGFRTEVAPGEWIDVEDPQGLSCLRLPGAGNAGYLAVLSSASTVGAGRHAYFLRGLSSLDAAPRGADRPASSPGPSSFAARFETGLRRREAAFLAGHRGPWTSPVVGADPGPTRVPAVGDRRTFQVLNAEGGFDEVQAVARYVSAQAALFVDEDAPAGGFEEADLAGLAADFDEVIHPSVTDVFGSPSDLDENERIVILFTGAVNRLTPRGSPGFVGGFFYGVDLLDREGSNQGEIFYMLVPDPEGELSDPRSRSKVLEVVPAVLAHEFQHMVHFNERVLVLGAESTEALWLSEGLAQMAEEVAARAFYDRGDAAKGDRFRSGNLTRARRYLSTPPGVSLIVATGQGTLEERGAAWLHTLYLWDWWGGSDVLGRLTKSTRTGIDNVMDVTGLSWKELFADWAAALYLDDFATDPYPFRYPTVDLRALLATSTGSYPLAPEVVGFTDFTRAGSLWSSSITHYIVLPPSSGSVALRLGGEAGGIVPAEASLGLRIVRLF